MNEIIMDMLLLTWSGREIDPEDLGPIEFQEVARKTWDSVEAREVRNDLDRPDGLIVVAKDAQKLLSREGKVQMACRGKVDCLGR